MIGFLLSAFGIVKRIARAAVDVVLNHPREVAIAGLLVLSWWLHRGWDRTIDQLVKSQLLYRLS